MITANQVTLARLALLPIGTILLYQGTRERWVALVAMTVVGCTDVVDGWLARRYGPTVLGGLMDPIADKVFIAMTMLPALDLGWLPVDVIALVFFREFLITAARTAYSRRELPLKTTYIAKVKTWYQMMLAGMIFLLGISPPTMRLVTAVGTAAAVVGGLLYYAARRRVWRGSVAFALSFGALLAFVPWDDQALRERTPLLALGLGWATVAITWASGGAYLFGVRRLLARKGLDADDLVRVFGSVTLPLLACLLLARHELPGGPTFPGSFKAAGGWQGPSWPIFSTVAVEFAIGGLDNLLAHQKRLGSWRLYGLRTVVQAALLGGALAVVATGGPSWMVGTLSQLAFGFTVVAAIVIFTVHRRAYLGEMTTRQARGERGATIRS